MLPNREWVAILDNGKSVEIYAHPCGDAYVLRIDGATMRDTYPSRQSLTIEVDILELVSGRFGAVQRLDERFPAELRRELDEAHADIDRLAGELAAARKMALLWHRAARRKQARCSALECIGQSTMRAHSRDRMVWRRVTASLLRVKMTPDTNEPASD